MASMNMIEALNSALDVALTRDPDTPISEGGIIHRDRHGCLWFAANRGNLVRR
jgi:hypothetical protein